MTDAGKRLSEAIRNLPPSDRLELVEQLLDSLDTPDKTVDEQWASEATDRLAAYRRGEIEAVSLEVTLALDARVQGLRTL